MLRVRRVYAHSFSEEAAQTLRDLAAKKSIIIEV